MKKENTNKSFTKINIKNIFGKKKDKNIEKSNDNNLDKVKCIELLVVNNINKLSLDTGKKITFLKKKIKELKLSYCNDELSFDEASILLEELNINFKYGGALKLEQNFLNKLSCINKKNECKPLVIGVFGHINHGKTSLISKIINKNIYEEEEITQDISIYKSLYNNENFFIIDTPGHSIFNILKFSIFNTSDIFLIVISLNKKIENETRIIFDEILSKNLQDRLIIAFTHEDLFKNSERVIKEKEIANDVNNYLGVTIPYISVSSKTGYGIDILLKMCFETYHTFFKFKIYETEVAKGEILYKYKKNKLNAFLIRLDQGCIYKNSYCVFKNSFGDVLQIKTMFDFFDIKNFPLSKICGFGFFCITFHENVNISINTLFFGNLEKNDAKAISSIELKKYDKDSATQNKEIINDSNVDIKLFISSSSDVTNQAIINYINSRFLHSIKIEKSFVGFDDVDMKFLKNNNKAIFINFCNINFNKKLINEMKSIGLSFYDFNNIYRMVEFLEKELENIKEFKKSKGKIVKIFKLNSGNYVIGCSLLKGELHVGNSVYFSKENFLSKVISIKKEKESIQSATKGFNFGIVLDSFNHNLDIGDEFIVEV